MKSILSPIVKGMVIGVANIIPGVSGGTMALVLGIYDRLILAVGRFGLRSFADLGAALRERDAKALGRIARDHDVVFLLLLLVGAILAIVSASHLMEKLLKNYHDPTYGFFFGLVATSVVVPYSLLKRKSWKELAAAVVAIGLALGLNELMSGEDRLESERQKVALEEERSASDGGSPLEAGERESLSAGRFIYLFGVGAVAISTMVLPGVSGSFVLLLLGAYFDILGAVNDRDLAVIAAFALGCLVGMVAFVKFLKFLLERYYSPTMAFLAGLMVGSLWSLWPFKSVEYIGSERTPFYMHNVWPQSFSLNETMTLLSAATGAVLVVAFFIYERIAGRATRSSGLPEESR